MCSAPEREKEEKKKKEEEKEKEKKEKMEKEEEVPIYHETLEKSRGELRAVSEGRERESVAAQEWGGRPERGRIGGGKV